MTLRRISRKEGRTGLYTRNLITLNLEQADRNNAHPNINTKFKLVTSKEKPFAIFWKDKRIKMNLRKMGCEKCELNLSTSQ
jgi:hypothetical protein